MDKKEQQAIEWAQSVLNDNKVLINATVDYSNKFQSPDCAFDKVIGLNHLPYLRDAQKDFSFHYFKHDVAKKYELEDRKGLISYLQQKDNLPASTLKKLSMRLKEIDEEEKFNTNMLNRWKGILWHEYGHYKNKDLQRILLASATLPFAIYLGTQLILPRMKSVVYSTSFVMQQFKKLAGGIGNLLTSQSLLQAYRKHREQEADNFIPNDPDVLQGLISMLKSFEEYKIDSVLKELNYEAEKLNETQLRFIKSFFHINHIFFDFHPPHEKRIERLQQRIDQLEKENK